MVGRGRDGRKGGRGRRTAIVVLVGEMSVSRWEVATGTMSVVVIMPWR